MPMLPLDYAARNCLRSPTRLIQLIVGSALVILLISFAAAFGRGMEQGLQASGDPKNVILLGSGSEESVERSEVAGLTEGIIAASIKGLATNLGEVAVSGEVYYNGLIQINGQDIQAILRGVTSRALHVHSHVRLIAGHWPGPNEILIGKQAPRSLGLESEQLQLGNKIIFEQEEYTIGGIFIAPGTVLESELWLNRQDLMTAVQRTTLSCIVVRLDSAQLGDLEYFATTRLDLELVALSESDYYHQLADFYQPISFMAWATALLIASGAMLGGINTLYAAFVSRQREFATLQAIGFSRPAIFISLLQESVLSLLLGTLLASAIGLGLLDGLHMSFASGVFALHWDASILGLGLGIGLGLGFFGTLPPAIRCLAPSLTHSLRGLA